MRIQDVIDAEIVKGVLDPAKVRVPDQVREAEIYHHEWAFAREAGPDKPRLGPLCLMVPGACSAGWVVHDVQAHEVYMLPELDGRQLDFVDDD